VKGEYKVHLQRQLFSSPGTWVLEFLDRCSKVEATVVVVTMWHLWDARNKTREGEGPVHPNSVASRVKAYVDMILQHLYKPATLHRCESSSPSLKWTPPPEGTVMINVDAALFASSRHMGIGIVIRDHMGTCLAACKESLKEVTLPELAEALALRRATLFASEEGFSNIIIGSDCLSVIQRVLATPVDRSLMGLVIEDIKRLARGFSSCDFRHVYRRLNVAAHSLARSCASFSCFVWRGVTPECIRQDICNDSLII
jgi:hypothetical protein